VLQKVDSRSIEMVCLCVGWPVAVVRWAVDSMEEESCKHCNSIE